jgi:ubiquinone/menaquinone biosynthesis C-methylase UbiE
MNWIHNRLCRSERWKRTVERELLPWALGELDLGGNPLEVGPGPGVTTDLLRVRCERLTCLEIEPDLAASLERRLRDTNVTVKLGDASAIPFEDDSFSGAACFTMLHHVPSRELQDRLLAEVCRVIRPGGWLAGSDSRLSFRFRLLHIGDTMVVSDPDLFGERLSRAGFEEVSVVCGERAFAFRGRKPRG